MVDDSAERQRIERVYRAYGDDPRSPTRWDPENPGNRFIDAERNDVVRDLLAGAGVETFTGRMLDIGCGEGRFLGVLRSWGADDIVGVDMLADRIARGRADGAPGLLHVGDARALALRSGSVRVAFAFTLLSSIVDRSVMRAIVAEVDRVLEPGGVFLSYDVRTPNPRNTNTRAIGRRRLASLFPTYEVSSRSCTLVPQLARRIGNRRGLYDALSSFPWLRTHLVVTVRKPA